MVHKKVFKYEKINKVMNIKLLLALFCLVLCINIASAEMPVYQQDTLIQYPISCQINQELQPSANLSVTISEPITGEFVVINDAAESLSGGYFRYNTTITNPGIYEITGKCCTTTCWTSSEQFKITKTGEDLNLTDSILYFILLGICIVFMILSLRQLFQSSSLWSISGLVSLSYFLLISVVFILGKIVNNFMPTLPAIGSFLDTVLIILIVGLLPLILGLIIYTLSHISDEKRINRMVAMGYDRETAEKFKRK